MFQNLISAFEQSIKSKDEYLVFAAFNKLMQDLTNMELMDINSLLSVLKEVSEWNSIESDKVDDLALVIIRNKSRLIDVASHLRSQIENCIILDRGLNLKDVRKTYFDLI